MRRGMKKGRCVGAAVGAALAVLTLFLASCQNIFTNQEISAQSTLNTYQVTVTATTPTGLTTGTITASFDNLTTGANLDSAGALPWSFTVTGTEDFTAPEVLNASVGVSGSTADESVRLVVVYEEFGPGDPVTHTIFDQTVSSPVGGNISVSSTFVLPYETLQ